MASPVLDRRLQPRRIDSFNLGICRAVFDSVEAHHYRGYNKHDALNSPLLRALTFNQKWLRILATQLVTRAPVNPRPLLGVRPTVNPKGMSLFVRSYLTLHEIEAPADGRDGSWLEHA